MPQPVYFASIVLFALFQIAAGGILLSVASRLKGLGLIGAGVGVVGTTGLFSFLSSRLMFTEVGRTQMGLISLYSTLHLGLGLLAWTLILTGAALVAGELRTRSSAARNVS